MVDENDILLSNVEEEINNILNSSESKEQAVEELLELGLNISDVEDRIIKYHNTCKEKTKGINNES